MLPVPILEGLVQQISEGPVKDCIQDILAYFNKVFKGCLSSRLHQQQGSKKLHKHSSSEFFRVI